MRLISTYNKTVHVTVVSPQFEHYKVNNANSKWQVGSIYNIWTELGTCELVVHHRSTAALVAVVSQPQKTLP